MTATLMAQGAVTPSYIGWYIVLGFAALAVLVYIIKVVVTKFSKSLKAHVKVPGGVEVGVEATNPDPIAPPSAPGGEIPKETIRLVMNRRDCRWEQGQTEGGKDCVNVVLHGSVTNIYTRPVKLVKAILLPSRREGGVGITRSGPRDYPGIDAFIPHKAMPCSILFFGLPREVCPAPGDVLVCGVVLIDQYGNEHTYRNVECPYGGGPA